MSVSRLTSHLSRLTLTPHCSGPGDDDVRRAFDAEHPSIQHNVVVRRIAPVASVVMAVVAGPVGIRLPEPALRLPLIHPVGLPDPPDPKGDRSDDLDVQRV